jgi:FAD/FMN-containing dehydrogenase
LGIIAEVNFKLRPVPFETRTVMVWGQREELLSSAQGVIHSRLFPVAVELLSQSFANAAELSNQNDQLLLLRFAGLRSAVVDQVTRSLEFLASKLQRAPQELNRDAQVWESLAAVSSTFAAGLVWRVGLRPTDISAFLAGLDQTDGRQAMWQVSVGDGRIRVIDPLTDNGEVAEQTAQDTIDRLASFRKFAKSFGVTVIIERAPSAIRELINFQECCRGSQGIMRRIKEQLDPNDIFPSL